MLRTPLPVVLVYVVPTYTLVLVAVILDPGSWAGPAVVFVAIHLGLLSWQRVVLTPEGLVIREFQSRLVPWNHIGAVGRSSFLDSGYVTIWDLATNRTRKLPTPRSSFRLGSEDVAAAQALVEQWWIANRGPAPAVNPAGRTPPAAAGQ